MNDGVAMGGKIEDAYLVVTVENNGIALCGVNTLYVEHTHIHTNSADNVSLTAISAVGRIDRDTVTGGVAENSVGIADSNGCGGDLTLNLVGAAVAELLTGSQTADARDLGAELEGGAQTEVDSGRGTESKDRNTDPCGIAEILCGARECAGRIAEVHDARVDPLKADAAQGIKKSDRLQLGALFCVLRGLVCNREMRENAVDLDALHARDLRDLRRCDVFLLLREGGEAKAVHTCIELDMRADAYTRFFGGTRELFGVVEGGDGLDEIVVSDLADEGGICRTEDEDIGANADLVADALCAKSLLNVGKRKSAATLGKEYAGAFRDAVTVGVTLDDGYDRAGRTLFCDRGGNGAVVVPDRGGVNLYPSARRAAERKVGVGYIKIMLHEITP